jgi:hypothetical protein
MVIAVQKGLTEIKEKLIERGYDVVTLGEYNHPVDALVYVGRGIDMTHIPNSTMSLGMNYTGDKNLGTLLINASNKSIDELDRIIKKRTYTPLF